MTSLAQLAKNYDNNECKIMYCAELGKSMKINKKC